MADKKVTEKDIDNINGFLNWLRIRIKQPIFSTHAFLKWREGQLNTPTLEDAYRAGVQWERHMALNDYYWENRRNPYKIQSKGEE